MLFSVENTLKLPGENLQTILHNYISPKFLLLTCCVIFFADTVKAQLCNGSLGDPVVNITFGAGTNPGPPLSAATTNYQYVTNACPVNGFYTVLSSGIVCNNYGWHVLQHDHTGNPNGYFMLVDASYAPSDFYLDTVKNLCANTTYEFAAWILNMKKIQQGIRPNITFKIETPGGVLLKSYNTGDVPPEDVAQWRQYGFYFTTPVNTPEIVLRMTNNAQGGDGNDLALDDITFRPCGPLLNPSINGIADTAINICDGDTTAVLLNASVVSGGYNLPKYQWQISMDSGTSWNDIPGINTASYKRLPTAIGKYLYRLSMAEGDNIELITCRVASVPLTVTVNPVPIATAINNGPKCANSLFSLTAGGGTTYKWNGPASFTNNSQAVIVNNAVQGAKYYVTVTNNAGCNSIDSTMLTVYANPVAQFAVSSPSCENSSIQFTDQSAAAPGQNMVQYNWQFGDSLNAAVANPSHIFGQAKIYPVSLAIVTDKGCTDTLVQPLIVHYLPVPDFVLPKVCLSDPFAGFTDASSIADSSRGGFSYLWNFGDGNATPGNPNSSTQKDPKHSYTSIGLYAVKLTITSNNGCIKDTLKPFTVNGALPKAGFTFANGDSICSNSNVILTDNSTVNFGNISSIDIYWDYNNNILNKLTDDSVQYGKKYQTKYPGFYNPASKGYLVKYIASSGINCINELDTVVVMKANPQLVFATINPVCEGVSPFTLTQAGNINGMNGTGVYSGNGTDAGGLFNPMLAGLGVDTIRYAFTASNGCSAIAEQQVQVYAQPVANAGTDRQLLQGGSLVINATASGNNISYLWTPDTNINNNKILGPSVSPSADITYTLTVTSADGCISKDSMHITVLQTPLIPNVFSPNGDGVNDRWMINYLDSYAGITIQVFNRYGQLVFSSIGYSTTWDGTYNGKPLPVGTYYYIIDRKIAAPKLTGSVTIVR